VVLKGKASETMIRLSARLCIPLLASIVMCLAAAPFLQKSVQATDAPPSKDARTRGNPNAPITLIEYSDFTCGYCAKFFRETWPALNSKYIQTGLVRFIYRDFPRASRGPGLQAAVAARCAGEQDRYWQMHDRLFAGETPLLANELTRHASAIGLDGQAFSACLRDNRHVGAIFRDRAEGASLGLRGTPGFVLIRTQASSQDEPLVIPGAFPFDVFDEEIERLLSSVKGKG
jgi:protein-disulfide isomerase